jgi:hypothetical protein
LNSNLIAGNYSYFYTNVIISNTTSQKQHYRFRKRKNNVEEVYQPSFDKIFFNSFPNPTNDIVTVLIPKECFGKKIEMYNSLRQFIGSIQKYHFASKPGRW